MIACDDGTKRIFHEATKAWGVNAQLELLQGECGELVAAVSQHRRGRKGKDHLIEEIGDVLIMSAQVTQALNVEDEVRLAIAKKLPKLRNRLHAWAQEHK